MNINFSKMRCRKLAWMLEDWPDWLYLTDAFGVLLPKHAISSGAEMNVDTQLSFGSSSFSQIPNGPNKHD